MKFNKASICFFGSNASVWIAPSWNKRWGTKYPIVPVHSETWLTSERNISCRNVLFFPLLSPLACPHPHKFLQVLLSCPYWSKAFSGWFRDACKLRFEHSPYYNFEWSLCLPWSSFVLFEKCLDFSWILNFLTCIILFPFIVYRECRTNKTQVFVNNRSTMCVCVFVCVLVWREQWDRDTDFFKTT